MDTAVIVLDGIGQLRPVVGDDPVTSELERLSLLGAHRVERGAQLGGRDRQLGQGHAVELGGVVAQRVVAAVAHRGQDRTHRGDRLVAVDGGTRKVRRDVGHPAQVESVQHVGASGLSTVVTVPTGTRRGERVAGARPTT